MIKGTVKFFNGTKGFGFITPDDGSKEVFVPTATVTSSGTGLLKAGQRVSFEAEQEAKGPKAVKLTLLDEPLREVPRESSRDASRDASKEQPKDQPRESSRDQTRDLSRGLTLYHEADTEESADVMAALEAAGKSARQVDYTVTPPSRDELKRLSVMLRSANQSLARRYEPLFMELQLDDRFLSENEFWTAISEHPTLINGPILVSSGKALICKSAEDVQDFLGNGSAEEKRPKGLSARMAAMMLGRAVPPPPAEPETRKAESAADEKPDAKSAPRTKLAVPPKKTTAPAKKPAASAKPAKSKAVKSKPAKKAKY